MPTPTFKARLTGGPHDGQIMETGLLDGDDLPETYLADFDGKRGLYRLVSYSKLPPDIDTTNLFRGAEYRWEASDG